MAFESHRKGAPSQGLCPTARTQPGERGVVARPAGHLGKKSSAVPGEMLIPLLSPWVKQRDDLTRVRVDPRQVRPFMAVAVAARESQVFEWWGRRVAER